MQDVVLVDDLIRKIEILTQKIDQLATEYSENNKNNDFIEITIPYEKVKQGLNKYLVFKPAMYGMKVSSVTFTHVPEKGFRLWIIPPGKSFHVNHEITIRGQAFKELKIDCEPQNDYIRLIVFGRVIRGVT